MDSVRHTQDRWVSTPLPYHVSEFLQKERIALCLRQELLFQDGCEGYILQHPAHHLAAGVRVQRLEHELRHVGLVQPGWMIPWTVGGQYQDRCRRQGLDQQRQKRLRGWIDPVQVL